MRRFSLSGFQGTPESRAVEAAASITVIWKKWQQFHSSAGQSVLIINGINMSVRFLLKFTPLHFAQTLHNFGHVFGHAGAE